MTILTLLLASTITLTAPENGATYDTHMPSVNEFLAHPAERSVRPPEPPLSEVEIKRRDEQNKKYEEWKAAGSPADKAVKPWARWYDFYIRNEWTEAVYKKSCEETKTWKPFKWTSDFKGKDVKVEFSETADFAKPIVETIYDDSQEKFPWFLKLGTKYWWRVSATDESGARVVSDVREFTTLDKFPRMIGTPGMNCRDMGGGTNMDGKKVRQGLIFRGQKAHSNSLFGKGKTTKEEFKWFFIDTLGIKTELDLRGKEEAEKAEKSWNCLGFEKFGAANHYFRPMYPYLLWHGDVKKTLVEVFHDFANKDNYPIYFNCSVGSDRTGTVGVLLDCVLGRSEEHIYDNYELPSLNWNLARLRYCRKAADMFGMIKPPESEFGGKTMAENGVKYLHSIGVPQADIDAIREIMLEK